MTLWPGIVFSVFGLVWFAIRQIELARDRRIARVGMRTRGEVVGLTTYPNDDELQTGQYRLLVEYEVDDRRYTLKSQSASMAWGREVGNHYTVLFDPARPDQARLEIDLHAGWTSWLYLLLGALGVLMILAEFFAGDGAQG